MSSPFVVGLILLVSSPTLGQITTCDDSCVGFANNQRCDEYGPTPHCALNTDCTDCRLLFPAWQIGIASVSLLLSLASFYALYRSRRSEQSIPATESVTLMSGGVQQISQPSQKGSTTRKTKDVDKTGRPTTLNDAKNELVKLQKESISNAAVIRSKYGPRLENRV